MRDAIFRSVSAVLLGLIVFIAVRVWIHDLDFPPGRDEFFMLVAVLLFAPTFAVYALLGEKAAYRILLPGLALLSLPHVVLEAVLRKTVTLPPINGDDVAPSETDPGGTDPKEE